MHAMELLTVNVSGNVRRDRIGEREYIVAPVTMIVPGVLNGSNGPLLYKREELQRNVDAWNRMPITVGHPQQGSARNPRIEDQSVVGNVFNARINGKLTAEGWFDIEALNRIEPRILDALESGRKIELSTGLITTNEPSEGTLNGREFIAIARNLRPDHLAILLEETGACSIQDGCGVNNQEVSPEKACEILRDGEVNGQPLTEDQRGFFGAICSRSTENESMTAEQRKETIDKLVSNCECWKDSDRETLNELSDQKLESFGKAFLTTNNESKSLNQATDEELEDEMKRRRMNRGDDDDRTDNKVMDIRKRPQTIEEWFAEAPPEIRQTFEFAQNVESEHKREIIERIVQNASGDTTSIVKKLQSKTVDELNEIASLIPDRPAAKPASYFGSAAPAYNTRGGATRNEEFRSAILPLPEMDWSQQNAS